METYSFPHLKSQDILYNLKEMNIDVEKNQLLHPTKDYVLSVYSAFLDFLMGVTKEGLEQSRGPIKDSIEYSSMYNNSYILPAMFKKLKRLMTSVGVPTFSVHKDIGAPTRENFRRNLSALINFTKFREQKLDTYVQYTSETDDLERQRVEAGDENVAMKAELNTLQERQRRNKPILAALNADTAELKKTILQLNEDQCTLRTQVDAKKAEYAKLKERRQAIAGETDRVEYSCQQLASIVVDDPAALLVRIEESRVTKSNLEESIASCQASLADFKAKVEVLTSKKEEILQCIADMKQIDAKQRDVVALRQQFEELQRTAKHLESERAQVERQEAEVRAKLQAHHHRAQRAETKRQAKVSALEAEDRALSAKLSQVDAHIQDMSAQQKEYEVATQQLNEQMKAMLAQHDAQMAQMKEEFLSMENQLVGYHEKLFCAMQGDA